MNKTAVVTKLFFFAGSVLYSQPYQISTIAGTNRLLDGISATSAPLRSPEAVAVDSNSNLLIADNRDNRVRKVDPSGVISTFAGIGIPGNTGDRGQASAAALSNPVGLALDNSGNLYIADRGNARIRRVSVAGVINTIAGNGNPEFFGDNDQALAAGIDPSAVAVDKQGNVYIADGNNFRIRKVDSNGIITTIIGTGSSGYSGDNGPAAAAQVSLVTALAVDSNGNLYFADSFNGLVRKIDRAGQVTPVAGNGGQGEIGDGIPATQAILFPYGIALDNSGSLYISDDLTTWIRRVDLSAGLIYTVPSSAMPAALKFPTGIAIGSNNQLFIADPFNFRVQKVTVGVMSTAAGTSIRDGGPATSAFLNFPEGLAVDGTNNVVVADTGDFAARRFQPGGNINTFGQLAGAPYPPLGVATDTAGNFYVTDDEPLVLKITPSGVTSTVAGNGQDGYSGDNGPATSAQISAPTGVAVDSAGNVYFTDHNHNRVRKVSSTGTITTIAGNGNYRFSGDNGPAVAAGLDPFDVAVDHQGNVYVVDQSNNRIRKITPDGAITTVAGTGAIGYGGDGGLATSALLALPSGIAVDNNGNLYIADTGNSVVRRVTANGFITTIAGNGTFYPNSGDGGPAAAAQLSPWRVALDASGGVYVTDSFNDRVRKLTPTLARPGAMTIVGGNRQSGPAGSSLPAPLVVKVIDTTGGPLPGVFVVFAASPSNAAKLGASEAITLNDGTASTTVTLGSNPGAVTITATASGLAATVTFTATVITPPPPSTSPPGPSIAAGGIASAGLSYPPVLTLAPNAIVSIFGANFAPAGTARNVGASDLVNGKIPTNLAGVCALFANERAPIFAVYPGQLNVQVPKVPSGTTSVQVVTQCDTPQAASSNTVNVPVQSAAPEFFYFVHNTNGHNPIAAINAVTGSYVGAAGLLPGVSLTPAKPGDILTLFGTGFGATSPDFSSGELPGTTASVTAAVTITFGNVTLSASDILYVGLTQEAGLYQVNIRVPDGVVDGDQSLILTVGGVESPAGGYITVSGSSAASAASRQ